MPKKGCLLRSPSNYIAYIPLFALIVIVALGLLSLIEDYGSIKILKPISIFSDIMQESTTADSVSEITSAEEAETQFPCPDDMQCFENYTNTAYPFDNLISKLLSGKEQARVAWFGDSFGEVDIIVGDFRDTLQSLYGGNGVGFMPITSDYPRGWRTVTFRFDGWNTASYLTSKKSTELGIGGMVSKPSSGAYVTYAGTKSSPYYKHTEKFSAVRLFYTSNKDNSLKIQLNNEAAQSYPLEATELPKAIVVNKPDIQRVAITMPRVAGNVAVYGTSLEEETGFYIDNYAMRMSTGLGLLQVREDFLKQFNDLLHYDLIILQFGLNIVTPDKTDYASYTEKMKEVIEKLRRAFPEAQILIMSVSDRSHKLKGKYTTMAGVPALLAAQRQLAIDNQAIFWNLFEAMGGMNSMPTYVEAKHPLAQKDYMHMNFDGGKKLGLSLASSFIHEVESYKKRREQNK